MKPYQRVIISLMALSLGACSYQPLYGTSATGAKVTSQLQSVSVEQKNDRTSQLIRNEILASTGNHDNDRPTRYRLGFKASSDDDDTVQTFNSDIVRKSYKLSVKYTLADTTSGKVVHRGNTFAHVSYDKTAAPFADYQARINAQERAAKEVGNDIRTRLAAYFASQ